MTNRSATRTCLRACLLIAGVFVLGLVWLCGGPIEEQIVDLRGINSPVLLDERNGVGVRFNGGGLPTTGLIDGEGLIRRRFMGARDFAVFEAILLETGSPNGIAPE